MRARPEKARRCQGRSCGLGLLEKYRGPGTFRYYSIHCKKRIEPLRVTHLEDEHLISLSSQEASALVDACAMVMVAAESVPEVALPAHVTTVLAGIFEQLSSTAKAAQSHQLNQSQQSRQSN